MSTLATIVKYSTVLEILANVMTLEKNKRHTDWKGRNKTVLLEDDMIFHVENPQEYTKNLLQLIHEFNKAAGYKSTHTHTPTNHIFIY